MPYSALWPAPHPGARPVPYLVGVAHPLMFDNDDPVLARVRGLVADFPDTAEKVSHGRPAFYTKKILAYYGGSVKVDGEYVQHSQSIMVLPDADERPALVEDPRVFIPAYLGPYGWIGIDLDDDTDWAEVSELLDASYRLTAPARSIAKLDSALPDSALPDSALPDSAP